MIGSSTANTIMRTMPPVIKIRIGSSRVVIVKVLRSAAYDSLSEAYSSLCGNLPMASPLAMV